MGLRDAFRSMRRDDGEPEEDLGRAEEADATWFRPRTDGWYGGVPEQGEGVARQLRFTAFGTVVEGVGLADEDVWGTVNGGAPELNRGDWTGVGSFLVQRRFERATIYTVLEFAEEAFRVRCTDTATGVTEVYRMEFQQIGVAG